MHNKFKLKVLVLLILLFSCASHPLPQSLQAERRVRLGIIGFKITAPVRHLSSIMENPQENVKPEQEQVLVNEELAGIEVRAEAYLVAALKRIGTIEPVSIPEGLFGIRRGARPSASQIAMLAKEYDLDSVLYGEVPFYGTTRLIYPILGEGLDITAETAVLGLATRWNAPLILGNVGFELLTSTPLWFGGAYIFGFAFRPVTIEAWAFSSKDGKEIWHKSVDKVYSRRELRRYPKSERSKKEIQLDVSLRRALDSVAESISK